MHFTKETCLGDITHLLCFEQMRGQFVFSSEGDWLRGKENLTLAALQEQNPTWYWRDIAFGLERLREVAQTTKQYVYSLPDGGGIIYLPAKVRKFHTWAILSAGGAYGAVCTLAESLPVAARLNELGMDCFCLNYRTATRDSFMDGLMPKPMEDLAQAWKYIENRETQFRLDAEDYIVGGFSAGGHLAAMWGTENHGARSFGIPNPRALLLAYPLVGLENLDGTVGHFLRTGLLGADAGEEKVVAFSAYRQITTGYPPVYLIQAEDDNTVPKRDSLDMEEALNKENVSHCIERIPRGGHGFGLGSATVASGWVNRALGFVEENGYAK